MARRALLVAVAAATALALVPAGQGAQQGDFVPYDQTPLLDGLEPPEQAFPAAAAPSGNPNGVGDSVSPPLHDGLEPDFILTLYDFSSDPTQTSPDGSYEVPFWKEATGTHGDVYVAWNDLAAPPTSSQQAHTITSAQTQYVGEEFDQRIWESDVFHFGSYLPRCLGLAPGDDSCGTGDRAAILVYNIRDDAYWTSYRFYIAGYFWAGLNDLLGINAVFVDSFDWANRLGPSAARPLLYEGVVAHEFEHLIHHDVDGDEDSFVDEGMADLAEQFLYGPVTTASHIGEYLFYHRDSLTDWDGELYDYGNGVLWQDYLWERADGGDLDATLAGRVAGGHSPFEESAAKFADTGDAFVWNLIHESANGLDGLASQLGGMASVESLHRDYALANLLDGKVAEPQWNYRNLALGDADSEGYTVDQGIAFYESNVNGNMPPTRKNVRRRTVVEPWGAYYRTFGGSSPGFTMSFSGTAQDGVAAYSLPTEWYSGLGNMLDITVGRAFTVAAGDTLTFQTWYDMEAAWDFGYVEASADGGATWTKLTQLTSLPNGGTTNVTGSSAWDGPGGLTGNSGGWQAARYDFGGLTGSVLVRFRYVTDEAVNGQGWYVDDVAVGASLDDVSSPAGWANAGWLFTDGQQANDWTADAYAPYAKAQATSYSLTPIALATANGVVSGSTHVSTQYLKNGKAYGVITNHPTGVFDAAGRLTILKGK